MATTKKPTGLSITRKGNKYIFSWSKPQSYGDGQQLQWSYKAENTHKSKIIKLSGSKHNYTVTSPSKLREISFRVRGNHDQKKKDPGWSDWAEKSFKVEAPKQPKIITTWESATPNKTVFRWETEDDEHKPFDHVEYRTMLVRNFKGNPSKYKWTGTPATSTSKTGTIFSSTESLDPDQSWTRMVQIRAVGEGGTPKKWKYSYHTYAKPKAPLIWGAEGKTKVMSNTTSLNIEYQISKSSARPIDKTTIQYKFVTPAAGMLFPPAETPDDADTPASKSSTAFKKYNQWAEEIDGQIGLDQCLFTRVKVTHDTRDNWSPYFIAQYGKLTPPSSVTTTPVQGTHTIVVNITSATTVPDAYHAVVYKKDGIESIMGIIPNGSTSVNMIVPPWTDSAGDVGVYAVVGTYEAQPADDDGVIIYTIVNERMASDVVWKGVISAPSINVVQADVEETATVTWDWTDPNATGAEVSWANHADAWESTDEPETYIVDASRASRLNVSGLDAGITWYFRVRLVTEGDETTYGLYSNIFALNLSSAPAIPSLEMSAQVIDPDGEAIASWVYVSGDNTPQAHATLALYSEGTYTAILQVDEEQTAVINPAALELAIGSYQLAVKVESESGQWSDYSDPIPFAVADPLACAFTQTSLVSDEEPINPETFTGNPIILDAGDPAKEVKNLDVELTPIQDLHGYDKPWSGGAGKNKLNPNDPDYGLYTISATGEEVTSSPDRITSGYIPCNEGESFTASTGVSVGGEGYNFAFVGIAFYDTNKTFISRESGNYLATFTATAPQNAKYLRFFEQIRVVQTVTSPAVFETYKQQLEKSATATTYEPYENICPITGHDSVTVGVTGKNIFGNTDGTYAVGSTRTITVSDGVWSYKVNTPATSQVFLPEATITAMGIGALSAGTYTFSLASNSLTDAKIANCILTLSDGQTVKNGNSFTVSAGTTIKSITSQYIEQYAVGTYTCEIQLEHGTTATSYEPYKSQSKTVTLPHTVYGAGVGVTSGVGKDKRITETLNGSEEGWGMPATSYFMIGRSNLINDNAKATIISDKFLGESWSRITGLGLDNAVGVVNGQTIRFHMTSITTLADWKTWLASNNVQVVYEIATPTDLTTTPTDLTLYNGDNVISSDGDMELTIADAVLDGYFLKEMPLTATVTGAGETGQTVLTIKRKNDYSILRPNDTELTGYADEVICQYVYIGEAQQTVNISDVLGKLNDGATYYLEATVTDNLGRTATARFPADDPNDYFTVLWDLQAIMPEATVEIIDDYYAKLTITKPQDWYTGDTIDIYRLTSDKPQLIAEGVEMEDTPVEYVDPYPTLGEGGYRFVYRTQNGDDTLDSANNFAWLDIPLTLDSQEAIIDFNGERLPLGYNLKVSNSWSKDFQETRYLGGHIAGDWTAGVSRTASVDTVTLPVKDASLFKGLRRLAEYLGICHLRTLDGSVITCNIDVDDDFGYDTAGKIQNVSLSITRVDPVDMDSMPLADWLVTP